MSAGKKCTACDCEIPLDAKKAGYMHVVDGIITGVAAFELCSACMKMAKKHPDQIVCAMRRAYAQGMN